MSQEEIDLYGDLYADSEGPETEEAVEEDEPIVIIGSPSVLSASGGVMPIPAYQQTNTTNEAVQAQANANYAAANQQFYQNNPQLPPPPSHHHQANDQQYDEGYAFELAFFSSPPLLASR